MLYFRENELKMLRNFFTGDKHSFAIYGRRRTGKTELVLESFRKNKNVRSVYYQCTSYDYATCLVDFAAVIRPVLPEGAPLGSFTTFRDLFSYLDIALTDKTVIAIDEFPFLCRKDENVAVEFQWIIDNCLKKTKLVLLGSNLSFMKHQLNDRSAPLYGRFDEMIELMPFTFGEVNSLFSSFDDAMDVYAQTGGVAQYVMFFKEFSSVKKATAGLFLNKNGRLFQEAGNLLLQELRDTTSYISILRSISGGDKDSGQIAKQSGLDPRGIFSYLNKLLDLGILTTVDNPLSKKKHERRYRIKDGLFRFTYSFIEPNISMITALSEKAAPHILDNRYSEYLGHVYEEIVRDNAYSDAQKGLLPFMPTVVGKWWGNIMSDGEWKETEIDYLAYDDQNIVIGECKYKNKLTGIKILEQLKEKAAYIPTKGRKLHFLLASKKGFTKDVMESNTILIEKTSVIKTAKEADKQ